AEPEAAEAEAQGEATTQASPAAEGTGAPATAPAPSGQAAAGTAADGRIKASPLARRLAEEGGVDLSAVSGSGPGGRIVKRDIEAALEGGAPAAEAPAVEAPALTSDAAYTDVPLSQMRKTIARRLSQSI